MFVGEYTYKLDEKGRVPVPPKFRRQLKDGAILVKGFDNCITIYPIIEWNRVSHKLAEKVVFPANLRRLNRSLFSDAFDARLDGQGRIKLPDAFRDYAKIGDAAKVIGANTYVEIWNEEEWKTEKASGDQERSQTIENLGV